MPSRTWTDLRSVDANEGTAVDSEKQPVRRAVHEAVTDAEKRPQEWEAPLSGLHHRAGRCRTPP